MISYPAKIFGVNLDLGGVCEFAVCLNSLHPKKVQFQLNAVLVGSEESNIQHKASGLNSTPREHKIGNCLIGLRCFVFVHRSNADNNHVLGLLCWCR